MNRFLEWWYRNDAVIRRESFTGTDACVEKPWGADQYPILVPIVARHVVLSVPAEEAKVTYHDRRLTQARLRRHTSMEIVYRVSWRWRRGRYNYSPDWRLDQSIDKLKLTAFAVDP